MPEPIMISVDAEMWHLIHYCVIDALENTQDILNKLENNTVGKESKKEKGIREMYQREEARLVQVLAYTTENGGAPF